MFLFNNLMPRKHAYASMLIKKTQNEQAIIILELVLYMLFGVVQLIQGFFPNGNRKIEASYILLSLFAKFFLGVMLFANVMFT